MYGEGGRLIPEMYGCVFIGREVQKFRFIFRFAMVHLLHRYSQGSRFLHYIDHRDTTELLLTLLLTSSLRYERFRIHTQHREEEAMVEQRSMVENANFLGQTPSDRLSV